MSKNLAVTFVGQLPPPVNGLATVNARLIEKLLSAQLLVSVFDTAPPASAIGIAKYPLRIWRVSKAMLAILRERFSRKRLSVVYMSAESGLGSVLLIGVIIVCRLTSRKMFLHHHNFSYIKNRSGLMMFLVRAASRRITHVFLCEKMRDDFFNAYRHANISKRNFCLSNAVFIDDGGYEDANSSLIKWREADLKIGILSNHIVEKGIDTFLEIFSRLRLSGVNISATIAGPAADKQVEGLIVAALDTHPDRLRWIGPLSGEMAKASFFSDVDVFVFPTRYRGEAQPLVLLEALSYGCEILATDIACIGCDHAESPGSVFSVESFVDLAEEWLCEASLNLRDRETMRREAKRRFKVLRNVSLDQLDSIINSI